jgi:hypothetical protein
VKEEEEKEIEVEEEFDEKEVAEHLDYEIEDEDEEEEEDEDEDEEEVDEDEEETKAEMEEKTTTVYERRKKSNDAELKRLYGDVDVLTEGELNNIRMLEWDTETKLYQEPIITPKHPRKNYATAEAWEASDEYKEWIKTQ